MAAAAAGTKPEVAETLDKVLTGPNDRAFVVCTFEGCTHNLKGKCTIYAVQDVPRMKRGAPCDSFEPRVIPDLPE